jgi:hypothetical protein
VGGFGAVHVEGAYFVFGDGAVRFLSSTIDPSVLRCLANRRDGQIVGGY